MAQLSKPLSEASPPESAAKRLLGAPKRVFSGDERKSGRRSGRKSSELAESAPADTSTSICLDGYAFVVREGYLMALKWRDSCVSCLNASHGCADATLKRVKDGHFNWLDHLVFGCRDMYFLRDEEIRSQDLVISPYASMWPRPQRRTIAVNLNIYHLGRGGIPVIKGINVVSRDVLHLGGLFHSGVEVCGLEWAYGATLSARCGMFCSAPRSCPMHTYRKTVPLGAIQIADVEVLAILLALAEDWMGNKYRLVTKNCNHFSLALAVKLGVGGKVPGWLVTRDRAARESTVNTLGPTITDVELAEMAAKEARAVGSSR